MSEKHYLKGDLCSKSYTVEFGKVYFVIELEIMGGVQLGSEDSNFYVGHRVRRCVSVESRSVSCGEELELDMIFKETRHTVVKVPSRALFSWDGLPKRVGDLSDPGLRYIPWDDSEVE